MKKALIVILAGLFLVAFLAVGAYAFLMYSLKAMHKEQPLAKNVQITSDWLEITPKNPLKPEKQVQEVVLLIEGYEHDAGKNDFGNIKLSDGTPINPEVQIVDENGKIYHLRDGKRTGNNVGFYPDKEIHGTSSFPKDVTFKAVRIRSDKPFRCKMISWENHDLK